MICQFNYACYCWRNVSTSGFSWEVGGIREIRRWSSFRRQLRNGTSFCQSNGTQGEPRVFTYILLWFNNMLNMFRLGFQFGERVHTFLEKLTIILNSMYNVQFFTCWNGRINNKIYHTLMNGRSMTMIWEELRRSKHRLWSLSCY